MRRAVSSRNGSFVCSWMSCRYGWKTSMRTLFVGVYMYVCRRGRERDERWVHITTEPHNQSTHTHIPHKHVQVAPVADDAGDTKGGDEGAGVVLPALVPAALQVQRPLRDEEELAFAGWLVCGCVRVCESPVPDDGPG